MLPSLRWLLHQVWKRYFATHQILQTARVILKDNILWILLSPLTMPSLGLIVANHIPLCSHTNCNKVPERQRNPLHTTTEGTGELMLEAYRRGHRHIIVGMVCTLYSNLASILLTVNFSIMFFLFEKGGSATNDGGLGCLHALGLKVKVEPTDGVHISFHFMGILLM